MRPELNIKKTETMSLPIACSLTDSQRQERRRDVLQKARRVVVDVRELENGYAYSFPANGECLTELAQLISFERQCCPFLRFCLTVEPDNGPIWLERLGQRELRNSSQQPLPRESPLYSSFESLHIIRAILSIPLSKNLAAPFD